MIAATTVFVGQSLGGAVPAAINGIARDSRHDTVEVREEGMAGMRVFSRWSMALVGEHGESDIPLAATSTGTTPAAARPATSDQDRVLAIMRDATRGYGRGS